MAWKTEYKGNEAVEFLVRLKAGKVSEEERLAVSELNLNNNRLSSLPPEIGQLTNLTNLDLWHNSLSSLPPEIVQLTNLTNLDLSWNNLSILPPVIGQLTNLRELDLRINDLNSLPPEIGQLTNLTDLDLSSNDLSSLPPEIGQLTNLTWLYLSRNDLSSLPPEIGQLTNLTWLYLGSNDLSSLPPEIGQLTNLMNLDLSWLNLDCLPPRLVLSWLDRGLSFTNSENTVLGGINLHNTILRDQNINIFLSNDVKRIREYCEDLIQQEEQGNMRVCNEARIVFLGDGQAGKTHTIERLLQIEEIAKGRLKKEDAPAIAPLETPGVNIKSWEPKDTPYHFRFWDFGGQEILYSLHRCFLTDGCLYVIILRQRDGNLTEKAGQWLDTVARYAKNARVLIAVNVEKPSDGMGKPNLMPNLAIAQLQEEYKELLYGQPIIGYCAKETEGDGFDDLVQTLLKQAKELPSVKRIMRAGEYAVKSRIENYKKELITQETFTEWCREEGAEQFKDDFAGWFRELGVCFRYESDSSYQLLNPNWITEAAYGLIRQIHNQPPRQGEIDLNHKGNDHGSLRHSDISTMLKNIGMAEFEEDADKLRFILQILRIYNLTFPLGEDTEFFPALCPEDSAGELAESVQKLEKKIVLEMEYDSLRDDDFFTMMVAAEKERSFKLENAYCYHSAFRVSALGLCATVEKLSRNKAIRITVYSEQDSARPYDLLRKLRQVLIRNTFEPKNEYILIEEEGFTAKLKLAQCLSRFANGKQEIEYFNDNTEEEKAYSLPEVLGLLYNEQEMTYISTYIHSKGVSASEKDIQEMLKAILDNTKQILTNEQLIISMLADLGEDVEPFCDEILVELRKHKELDLAPLEKKRGKAFFSVLSTIILNLISTGLYEGTLYTDLVSIAQNYGTPAVTFFKILFGIP